MIDATACATWGAEIRSIIITSTIALALLVAWCALLSIGWARAVGKHMDQPDPDEPEPTRRPLLRGRHRA